MVTCHGLTIAIRVDLWSLQSACSSPRRHQWSYNISFPCADRYSGKPFQISIAKSMTLESCHSYWLFYAPMVSWKSSGQLPTYPAGLSTFFSTSSGDTAWAVQHRRWHCWKFGFQDGLNRWWLGLTNHDHMDINLRLQRSTEQSSGLQCWGAVGAHVT